MDYQIVKALHIIFVVSWFAGLFYIVRLFIYHVEAQQRDEFARNVLSKQFERMESKLWWIITTPAMIFTVLFGAIMLSMNWPYFSQAGWMHVKLVFIVVLLVYHFVCQKILFDMKRGHFNWKSGPLRMWNELATLCLVAIAFLVTMKNTMSWWKGTLGFFGVAIGLLFLIKLYKRMTKNSANDK